jgi:hypothetical protein
LITGFILPLHLTESNETAFHCTRDYSKSSNSENLFEYTTALSDEEIELLCEYYKNKVFIENNAYFCDLIYVLCRHGKSKNLGVWNFKKLIESNRQLLKCDISRCNGDFILPDDLDLKKTLASKIIVFN